MNMCSPKYHEYVFSQIPRIWRETQVGLQLFIVGVSLVKLLGKSHFFNIMFYRWRLYVDLYIILWHFACLRCLCFFAKKPPNPHTVKSILGQITFKLSGSTDVINDYCDIIIAKQRYVIDLLILSVKITCRMVWYLECDIAYGYTMAWKYVDGPLCTWLYWMQIMVQSSSDKT